MTIECDAARTLKAMGREPNCSDDRIEVWFGMDYPAYACGYHGQPGRLTLLNVFKGARARKGEHVTVRVTWPEDAEYEIPRG